ncbi:hypothetical protein GOP47_0013112 [Adiantum capillus-veneris]|uniref:Uncharacterized protein n=1 Tax=Adiantum capillus-veneris TaxID=13818 RepID=A0A9D4USH9_ADICA|nr:hypothetical protein GOP47_0013112 [Adiantum capillus-veneris]
MSNTSAKLLKASTKSSIVRRDSSSSATSTTSSSASSTSRSSSSSSTKSSPFSSWERAAAKSLPALMAIHKENKRFVSRSEDITFCHWPDHALQSELPYLLALA